MISVLILTYNEAVNIAECISSLPWRDDIYVLDSASDDGTRDIAAALGANVVVRPFDNYASQRQAGLALPFVNEWIVMLDCDERMTAELAEEIEAEVRVGNPDVGMMRVRRKDYFMSKWLRRSSGYPTWFARVVRRGRVRVERAVNETYDCDGKVLHLRHHLFHYPFNKGLDWWFERHNRYSRSEADLQQSVCSPVQIHHLFSRDPAQRRAAMKGLAYSIPGRSWGVFIYLYVLRLGFLDGAAGYRYATMRLAYELMIDAKSAGLRAGIRN